MKPWWGQVIWKEWGARQTIWLGVLAVLCSRMMQYSFGGILVGLFLGHSLFEIERTAGTLPFTLTRPVPRWMTAWVKWGSGMTLALTMLSAAWVVRWLAHDLIEWPMLMGGRVQSVIGRPDWSWAGRIAVGIMWGMACAIYVWIGVKRQADHKWSQVRGLLMASLVPLAVEYLMGGKGGHLTGMLWMYVGLTVLLLAAMPGQMERYEFSAQEG